jgi:transposase
LFWPDFAPAHYANEVIEFFESENMKFLPLAKNPPNVPEAISIEDFWAYLKRQVYTNKWEATSLPELK